MSIEHVFTAYFHLAWDEESTSERRDPTDSLNVHCTKFFRQDFYGLRPDNQVCLSCGKTMYPAIPLPPGIRAFLILGGRGGINNSEKVGIRTFGDLDI